MTRRDYTPSGSIASGGSAATAVVGWGARSVMRPIAIAAAVLLLGASDPGRAVELTTDPVKWVDADDKPIPEPAEIDENQVWDIIDHTFFFQIGKVLDLGWTARRVGNLLHLAPPREADNVNALDEVPASSWYTNRHFMQRLSIEELEEGPGYARLDDSGPWEIVAGKFEGGTAGFTVKDASGQLFLLKFDHGSAADPRYDDVTMWVDPVLTENPNFLVGGLSARSIMRADLGGGLHAFDEITIANAVQATHEIVFDEFIITDDYADIFDVVGVTRFQEGVSPTVAYTQDAVFIRENEPTANQNGDTDRELIVGFLNDDTEVRGLLEFDVSAIPASDTINSASLVLRQEAPQGGQGGSITVNLYEYDHDIVESVSDWNDPDGDGNDGTGDATRGGTFGSLLTSATFDANTQDADVTFSDSAAFRTAVSDALADDGVLRLIIARSDSSGSGYRFARFDDETVPHVAKRPELIVAHYDAPPHGTLFVIR